MISHSKRFIFVHVPRTGGYTVKSILSKYSPDVIFTGHDCRLGDKKGWKMFPEVGNYSKIDGCMHPKIDFYIYTHGATMVQEYTKFSVVRNPWDRMVSYATWYNGGTFDYDVLKKILYEPENTIGANEITQIQYLEYNGRGVVNHIIPFDYYETGLNAFFKHVGIEERIPTRKRNNTTHKKYWDLIKGPEKDHIEKVCAKEIEIFNFKYGGENADI